MKLLHLAAMGKGRGGSVGSVVEKGKTGQGRRGVFTIQRARCARHRW